MKKKKIKLKQNKKNRKVVFWLIVLAVLFLIAGIVYQFSYTTCSDEQCFLNALYNCNRVVYNDGNWYFKIVRATKQGCMVYVKNIKFEKAELGIVVDVEGKDMTCIVPYAEAGSFMPQEKLEYCHGWLKEALQEYTIKKLHLYIVQNMPS